jgi:uncharacterized protein (DUF1499 family)
MSQTKSRQNFSRRWLSWRLAFIPLITIAGLALLSFTAAQPDNLGVSNGKLANCPDSPNCVCSQATSESHKIPSVKFTGLAGDQVEKIKRIVDDEFSRVKLVSESEYYLRYEFKSLIFRFVDDVEFFVDDANSEIHFRSASRVGHSDMGTNRKRMTKIIERLLK